MATVVTFSERDLALLTLLSWTPATTRQLFRAHDRQSEQPFRDERRLRERLQALVKAGLLRPFPSAVAGGGLENYYKLTPEGYRTMYGSDTELPPKAYFAEISPSRFAHTMTLAAVIIQVVQACQTSQVRIMRFGREGEVTLSVAERTLEPDCTLQLSSDGISFNVMVEVDLGTESVVSAATSSSLERKIAFYESYQDMLLSHWNSQLRQGPRPAFRALFLSRSMERVMHTLVAAAGAARNRDRRLVYAATLDAFAASTDPLRSPILLDHAGHWQALVDPHPSAEFLRAPVRLPVKAVPSIAVC